MRGRGAADDDVGIDDLAGQVVEANGLAAEALRQPDRAVVAPVRDEHGAHAAVRERLRGQLAVLSGPYHQHAPGLEIAQRIAGEIDGDRRHRHARASERGLRAHPLAGAERVAEEPVRDRPRGALDERQLVRALHLPLDLGLADDHRVEPGRDREQVTHGVGAAERVEAAEQLGRPDARLARQLGERQVLGLHGVGGDQVELGAVAGRDGHGLVDLRPRRQVPQDPRGAALRKRQPLAQRHGGGLVRDAESEQRVVHFVPRLSTSSFSVSSSFSMRLSLEAMMAM